MTKKHLKRLNTPRTWNISKSNKYIKRPNPGAHDFTSGVSLTVLLRDMLKFAKSNKEVKNIINNHEILIDGVRRKEVKFIVGFMDVITIAKTKEHFRIIYDKKGKLSCLKIKDKESNLKICKVKGKRMHKGKKLQINLMDGKNIEVTDNKITVGDSVLLELKEKKIKEILKLSKGATVFLTGGKHIGSVATVEDIKEKIMKCKSSGKVFETSKKYAYVIGKEKPLLKVE